MLFTGLKCVYLNLFLTGYRGIVYFDLLRTSIVSEQVRISLFCLNVWLDVFSQLIHTQRV